MPTGIYPRKRTPLFVRFHRSIDKSGGPDACWLWTATKNNYGYGLIYTRRDFPQSPMLATHIAWFFAYGTLPSKFICHTCDNPACVNPKHFWLGFQKENAVDMVKKGRSTFGEKHGGAVLTEKQVAAIRADARSQSVIAADYEVHQSTISRLKMRKRWKHS